MKFYLYKASDPYQKGMEEIEINTLEDLKKLQKEMQKNYRQKENRRLGFSRCDLILNLEDAIPTIQVYDDYIE